MTLKKSLSPLTKTIWSPKKSSCVLEMQCRNSHSESDSKIKFSNSLQDDMHFIEVWFRNSNCNQNLFGPPEILKRRWIGFDLKDQKARYTNLNKDPEWIHTAENLRLV